jgi:hypothetical protein
MRAATALLASPTDLVGLGQPAVQFVVEVGLGPQQQFVHPILSLDVLDLVKRSLSPAA